jgi:hypothetical protein
MKRKEEEGRGRKRKEEEGRERKRKGDERRGGKRREQEEMTEHLLLYITQPERFPGFIFTKFSSCDAWMKCLFAFCK